MENALKVKIGKEWFAIVPINHLRSLLDVTKQDQGRILFDIKKERKRQNELHPEKLTMSMRFVTIMEELGEVAEAMQDKDYDQIYQELIESAAVCIRMAEEVLNKNY